MNKGPRPNFLVYIVESPSPKELYEGMSEGELLERALSLADIECERRLVVNRDMFEEAIGQDFTEAVEDSDCWPPVLHFSLHGDESGIELTNGDEVSWDELREMLIPVNSGFDETLTLCMSACQGVQALQAAMNSGALPFVGVIGPTGDPTWSDAAIAYAAFYHLLVKTRDIDRAVEGMKAASGYNGFTIAAAEDARRAYLEGMRRGG